MGDDTLKIKGGEREPEMMALRIREPAAPPGDLGSTSSSHWEAHNCL